MKHVQSDDPIQYIAERAALLLAHAAPLHSCKYRWLHAPATSCTGILRSHLRIMRKPAALAALIPTLRGGVLAATLTQPDK
jgi:hypothetical protein